LTAVELLTIAAIYSIRHIIDFLNSREAPFAGFAFFLFFIFAATRFGAIFIRNYYDLHVYNYYRFVQLAI
jgi:ABC-type multidrug transport system fused ATPase/permease subunit